MNKQQAMEHIEKVVGFVPHKILFELFDDEQDIPQEIIDIECDYFKQIESQSEHVLYVGADLYKKLKEEGIF